MKSETDVLKEELAKLCESHKLCANNLPQVLDKLSDHFSLLLKWNQKISLTTITNPKLAALQLYFESLYASKFISDKIKTGADIGSGAGFPGLALGVALPEVPMTLIESDRRKAAFLGEARRNLGLTNLQVTNERFENISTLFDLVMVRALEKLEQQTPNILKFAKSASMVIFFVSLEAAEKLLLGYKQQLLPYKTEIIPLPESQNRVLLQLCNSGCST